MIENWIGPHHLGSLRESNCKVPIKTTPTETWKIISSWVPCSRWKHFQILLLHLSPHMHYDNGSEAATQSSLKLMISKLEFRSDNLATGTAPSFSWRAAQWHRVLELGRECDGCDLGHWEKPLHPLKNKTKKTPLSFDQGERYASYRCVCVCASKQMEEGLLKMCRLLMVACVCTWVCGKPVCSWFVPFFKKINMRALDTPSTVVPRLCCFQSTGGDSSVSRVLNGPAFIHWMSHSFHSIITTPRSHLLCSDTVAKGDNVWPLPVLGFYLSAIGSITSPIGSDNLLICKDSVEPSCPDAFSSLLPCN